jgi:molybdopterin synthase sulfur carrier subunit
VTQVRLDEMLREFVPRLTLPAVGKDLGALLDDLEAKYPRLRFRLRDETGEVRRFVRIFVNGEDVAFGQGLKTPVQDGDKVDILHSIQGG